MIPRIPIVRTRRLHVTGNGYVLALNRKRLKIIIIIGNDISENESGDIIDLLTFWHLNTRRPYTRHNRIDINNK